MFTKLDPVYDKIFLSLDIDDVQAKFEKSVTTFLTAEMSATEIAVTVDGYDDDPRDIWNIPEVMAYLKRLYHALKANGATFHSIDPLSRALFLFADGRAETIVDERGITHFYTYPDQKL